MATNDPLNEPASSADAGSGSDGHGGGVGEPDPAGGGCLKLGWGCLPVMLGAAILLPSLII